MRRNDEDCENLKNLTTHKLFHSFQTKVKWIINITSKINLSSLVELNVTVMHDIFSYFIFLPLLNVSYWTLISLRSMAQIENNYWRCSETFTIKPLSWHSGPVVEHDADDGNISTICIRILGNRKYWQQLWGKEVLTAVVGKGSIDSSCGKRKYWQLLWGKGSIDSSCGERKYWQQLWGIWSIDSSCAE